LYAASFLYIASVTDDRCSAGKQEIKNITNPPVPIQWSRQSDGRSGRLRDSRSDQKEARLTQNDDCQNCCQPRQRTLQDISPATLLAKNGQSKQIGGGKNYGA